MHSPERHHRTLLCRRFLAAAVATALPLCPCSFAQIIDPQFDQDYVIQDLGSAAGVLGRYGAVAFSKSDPNLLLIGGNAASPTGKIFAVTLVRDGNGHITGFQGTATEYADSPQIDGGLAYGPSDVLFYTRWPNNEVGQILPGSTAPDKVISLDVLGIPESPGALRFVPGGFPGAGQLKIAPYGASWYSASVVGDGSGTYDLTNVVLRTTLSRVAEGFDYVPPQSPQLQDFQTVMVNEYQWGTIAAYDVDANGDPIPASRLEFASGITNPLGLAFDPVSGDMVVTSYKGMKVYVVRGFGPACSQPGSWSNYGQGWPGTLGIPAYTCSANPAIGTSFDVVIGNSSGEAALAYLLLGFQSATIPTNLDGSFELVPLSVFPLVLPQAGLTVIAVLPPDPALCSLPVFTQVIQVDPGASKGVSFTQGLNLILGS